MNGNQKQRPQGGLVQGRKNNANNHKNREYFFEKAVQFYADFLSNNFAEFEYLNGCINADTPENLK
ncbi:hypothetical protein SDC9_206118 [bioreactor metagenome]|uniref:Uncharacterized protein n=1 Tax=bioreactor metagenome TaxID=1076179 RepID=A0A645JFP3_9ZZZZ